MPNPETMRKVRLPYGELTKLAERLGRSPSTLSRFFSGDRPSRRLAAEIEQALGVDATAVEVSRRRHEDAEAADATTAQTETPVNPEKVAGVKSESAGHHDPAAPTQ